MGGGVETGAPNRATTVRELRKNAGQRAKQAEPLKERDFLWWRIRFRPRILIFSRLLREWLPARPHGRTTAALLLGHRFGSDQRANPGDEIRQRLRPLIGVVPVAHGHLAGLLFAVAHYQHVWDLL